MITDGKNGLLYQSGNPKELANKILYLESMDTATLNNISANSYKKFINLYSEEAHLKKINEIYGF
jgi:glycosyltransferase involved in cell wall biosynthesis